MLPDPEDGHFVRDTLRLFELAAPTFRYMLREAIDKGHLAPHRIYQAMTVKTAAEDGFEVAREELAWTAMDPATPAELGKLFASSDPITVDPRALERTWQPSHRAGPVHLQRRYVETVEATGAVARVRESSTRTAVVLMASLMSELLGCDD